MAIRSHIIAITKLEDDEFEHVVFHNDGCQYDWYHDQYQSDQRKRMVRIWACDLAAELDNVGFESIFPERGEIKEGYWEVMIEWHRSSDGPWGPAEYDSTIETRYIGGPDAT